MPGFVSRSLSWLFKKKWRLISSVIVTFAALVTISSYVLGPAIRVTKEVVSRYSPYKIVPKMPEDSVTVLIKQREKYRRKRKDFEEERTSLEEKRKEMRDREGDVGDQIRRLGVQMDSIEKHISRLTGEDVWQTSDYEEAQPRTPGRQCECVLRLVKIQDEGPTCTITPLGNNRYEIGLNCGDLRLECQCEKDTAAMSVADFFFYGGKLRLAGTYLKPDPGRSYYHLTDELVIQTFEQAGPNSDWYTVELLNHPQDLFVGIILTPEIPAMLRGIEINGVKYITEAMNPEIHVPYSLFPGVVTLTCLRKKYSAPELRSIESFRSRYPSADLGQGFHLVQYIISDYVRNSPGIKRVWGFESTGPETFEFLACK